MSPKIRLDIEAVPFRSGDNNLFLLYDRSGISTAQLALSADMLTIVKLLNGENSLVAIQDIYWREHQAQLTLDDLEKVIADLAAADFLDDPRFHDYYAELLRSFQHAPIRPATSAGSAYSDNYAILNASLTKYLQSAPIPEDDDRATNAIRRAPRAVIVPHMDFSRAGKIYAQVYRELQSCQKPDAVIVIGTAHYPLKNRYALCPKDFAIPNAVMRYHRELTDEILSRSKTVADFTTDILAHRTEHSIELQLVWLRHIWGEIPIVPLLASAIDDLIINPALSATDNQLQIFSTILADLMQRYRLTILASADLAHVGKRFGDQRELDETFLRETERADREYLAHVKNGDALNSLNCLHQHRDAFHLCGTGSIYALNTCLPKIKGRILGYHQAITAELEQAVSCAGLIFE